MAAKPTIPNFMKGVSEKLTYQQRTRMIVELSNIVNTLWQVANHNTGPLPAFKWKRVFKCLNGYATSAQKISLTNSVKEYFKILAEIDGEEDYWNEISGSEYDSGEDEVDGVVVTGNNNTVQVGAVQSSASGQSGGSNMEQIMRELKTQPGLLLELQNAISGLGTANPVKDTSMASGLKQTPPMATNPFLPPNAPPRKPMKRKIERGKSKSKRPLFDNPRGGLVADTDSSSAGEDEVDSHHQNPEAGPHVMQHCVGAHLKGADKRAKIVELLTYKTKGAIPAIVLTNLRAGGSETSIKAALGGEFGTPAWSTVEAKLMGASALSDKCKMILEASEELNAGDHYAAAKGAIAVALPRFGNL